ncbi:MAG: hypothetical protein NWE89_13130 [Candidatus Bathyarchaeota archaeon]|nr:hypothetical protein [Candidatus Bathyarchaeota archaeon]
MSDVAAGKRIYGKTLDVYLCILTADGGIGVRDVWRALDFSSPSLAQYHINKLLDLKLIETDFDGKYVINDKESIDALRSFLLLRGMLIPRLTIYSALLLGLMVSYVSVYPWRGDFRDLTTMFIGLFSAAAFLFEAVKQYRGLSFMKDD